MADYTCEITDGIGARYSLAAGAFWGDLSDNVGLVDDISQVVPYVVTISDGISLIDSHEDVHGRSYSRKGRSQHGGAPPTSIPYRSRMFGN